MESKLEIGSSNITIDLSEFFAFKNSNVSERKFCSPELSGSSSLSTPRNSLLS